MPAMGIASTSTPQHMKMVSEGSPEPELPSAHEPNWVRETSKRQNPRSARMLLRCVRAYERTASMPWGLRHVMRRLISVRHQAWQIIAGCEIPLCTRIGGGLLMPHPNGIIIHPRARIGVNCLLFQQVTIGMGNGDALPVLEGHVDVGAGAKILGGVHIGAHAKIGANAVVLCNVPAGYTAVGAPARLIPPR